MAWCTVAEVKAAIDFPTSDAPISDANITSFIEYSQEEIVEVMGTKFGNVEDSGTATSGTTTTLTLTGAGWTVNEHADKVLWIDGGTGSGQYAKISSNTATVLTFTPTLTTAPDNTSTFKILTLGYRDDTEDGNDTDEFIVRYQPLVHLISLTIDSTSVTTSRVYKTLASGKLRLASNAERSSFDFSTPQLIDLQYVYGVYPLPSIIKRLCICLAGIRTLIAQTAGTYDDFTSVSMPAGFSASKGEPYMNIKAALDYLQNEAKGIVYGAGEKGTQVSGDWRKIPSYRPLTHFG